MLDSLSNYSDEVMELLLSEEEVPKDLVYKVARQAVLAGANLIVIDPRKTELTRYAKVHLQLHPGTNIPLLNSIAHVILFDGLAYGMLLFILAVGLAVTLGLMIFVNLAHGAFAIRLGPPVVTDTSPPTTSGTGPSP